MYILYIYLWSPSQLRGTFRAQVSPTHKEMCLNGGLASVSKQIKHCVWKVLLKGMKHHYSRQRLHWNHCLTVMTVINHVWTKSNRSYRKVIYGENLLQRTCLSSVCHSRRIVWHILVAVLSKISNYDKSWLFSLSSRISLSSFHLHTLIWVF